MIVHGTEHSRYTIHLPFTAAKAAWSYDLLEPSLQLLVLRLKIRSLGPQMSSWLQSARLPPTLSSPRPRRYSLLALSELRGSFMTCFVFLCGVPGRIRSTVFDLRVHTLAAGLILLALGRFLEGPSFGILQLAD